MPHRKPTYLTNCIGAVSEGTLRDEDLINSFGWELRQAVKTLRINRETRSYYINLLLLCNCYKYDPSIEEASDLINDLIEALNNLAPPYCYFGSNEGDGACFGFWPILDSDLPRIEAGNNLPSKLWGGDVYIINDHGNIECGHINNRGVFQEYWACV
jgi:hypothetical protein